MRMTLKLMVAILVIVMITNYCYASEEVVERVVAIVDDEVVLLSEFNETFRVYEEAGENLTNEEVINQMINRIILLREAKRFGLNQDGRDRKFDNNTINEFIYRRIKAFIHVPFDDIKTYYNNSEKYNGREFYDVKDEIEELLVSKELVKRLREYIREQRQKSFIRVQLTE